MVITGDCLCELQNLTSESVDLVYMDPPFFTQKKHSLVSKANIEYSFDDIWENIESYKKFIRDRLKECYRVLKKTGSLFLHCDKTASHHLRLLLDDVFGEKNFRSEIIWSYKRWSNNKKGLLNSHQNIFFYSKSPDFKFKKMYEDYSLTTNIDQIFQKRVRDNNGKTKYKTKKDGTYELIEEKKGVPLSDVWEIPFLNPKAKERTGYPTQKPIILLERIISLVTDENDIVLDPFCGSGTALVAAKLLNRQYMGIDISREAVNISERRLENPVKTDSLLLNKGKGHYKNQEKYITDILKKIGAQPVQRNNGIDGFLKINDSIKPVPIRIQRKDETLERAEYLLLEACKKNLFVKKILIRTNDRKDDVLFQSKYQTDNDKGLIILSLNSLNETENLKNNLPISI